MSKPFFEVFPTLKMNEELRMLLESVEVLKVATNSSREFIRVHLRSRHLIQKKEIYDLEKRIKMISSPATIPEPVSFSNLSVSMRITSLVPVL